MGVCCVDGCEPGDPDDSVYFPVPVKPALRRKWRDAIKSTTKLHQDSKICSRHFRETDYGRVRGKLRLKASVVPSIFDERGPPAKKSRSSSPENSAENKPDAGPCEKSDIPEPDSSLQEDVAANADIEDNIDENEERCTIECVPEAILQHSDSESHSESELHNDIEDIIAPYHIQQNKQLASKSPPPPPSTLQAEDKDNLEDKSAQLQENGCDKEKEENKEDGKKEAAPAKDSDIIDISAEPDRGEDDDVVCVDKPAFIEISVDPIDPVKSNNKSSDGARDDCLMLLENVEVDIDPNSLMLPEREPEEPAKDWEPISLLTSSDDDDVILQEAHISTVEVSSDTDEDDMPLVKLVRPDAQQRSIARILWGTLNEHYCFQCPYTTCSRAELDKHKLQHSKVLLVCEICNFTSASKSQFARHKKKHKEEKRFKCHLCEYKARHNMALVYHMKSHEGVTVDTIKVDDQVIINDVKRDKKNYMCGDCRFKTSSRRDMTRHTQTCDGGDKPPDGLFRCDRCVYSTKRRNDMKRHKLRKHKQNDEKSATELTP